MIPLNKPAICKTKRTHDDLNTILARLFPDFNFDFIFSARQGLDLIYRELYSQFGSCKVAVSPLTCFEALYPILSNQHELVFVDIDPETFNMNEYLIPDNTNVVQAIHLGGNPQRMDIIVNRVKEISAILVEDCAQGLGSKFNDISLGLFGDYSVFSFEKNLYALGGGLLVFKDEVELERYEIANFKITVYRYLKRLLESRSSYNTKFIFFLLTILLKLKSNKIKANEVNNFQLNKRMIKSINNQMGCIDSIINRKVQNAKKLLASITNNNFIPQKVIIGGFSNYTRLLFKLESGNAMSYIEKIRKRGIAANHLTQNWLNPYQESVFHNEQLKLFAKKYDLPEYIKLHDKIISLPVSAALTDNEMLYIAKVINNLR